MSKTLRPKMRPIRKRADSLKAKRDEKEFSNRWTTLIDFSPTMKKCKNWCNTSIAKIVINSNRQELIIALSATSAC